MFRIKKTINMKYLVISILTGTLLCTCEPKDEVADYLDGFNIKPVSTTTLEFDSLVAVPMHLFVKDSVLFINEFRRSGSMISFWNKNTGKLLYRKFPVGRGPGEHLPPMFPEYGNDSLGIFNKTDYLYQVYTLDSMHNPELYSEAGPFKSRGFPMWVKRLSGSKFLAGAMGRFENPDQQGKGGRFGYFNASGELTDLFDIPFPEFAGDDGYSDRVRSIIFQGTVNLKPDGSRLVMAGSDVPFVEIYSIAPGGMSKIYENRVETEVKISEYSDNNVLYVRFADDHIYGYGDLFATDNTIYLLYSGESLATENRLGYRYILMLDWDGNPKGGYELDAALACFTVDEKYATLYGVNRDYDKLIVARLD